MCEASLVKAAERTRNGLTLGLGLGLGLGGMEQDTKFAKRMFPANAGIIDELAARQDSFRDLCSDFAVADELMRQWEISKSPESKERHTEFVELVDGLRKEIEDAVSAAKVIRLPRRRL
jgi:hypothetical protein